MVHLLLLLASQTASIVYETPSHPSRVRVIGDFNHWDAPGLKMQPSADRGRWQIELKVDLGAYRYVCLENGAIVPTGDALKSAEKWLLVPPADYAEHPGRLDDGIITKSGLSHHPDARDTWRLNKWTIELRFRTRHEDVRNVSIAVSQPDAEQKDYPMVPWDGDPVFDWFTVKIVVNSNKPFSYRFILDDGEGPKAFDTAGLSSGMIGAGDPFQQDPRTMPIVKPPERQITGPVSAKRGTKTG